MDHDISPHSDHCINCGLSRYDAEGVICWPSTDDSPEGLSLLRKRRDVIPQNPLDII
jgi:hypothetical protein